MFSPWLLLILVACVYRLSLGKATSRFLVIRYSLQQTPVRRQLDYLRVLSASKEGAKELKLFGLSRFFTGLFQAAVSRNLSTECGSGQTKAFCRFVVVTPKYGGLLRVLCICCLPDRFWEINGRHLTFLAGAIAGACNSIQSIFSLFSTIADQSLFLTDLLEFFRLRPQVQSKPETLPAPRPIQQGFQFVNVSFSYPGSSRLILDKLNLRLEPGERLALIGENGQGKTTHCKTPHSSL